MAADLKNLGYKVTTRLINYGALVRQEWGEEWNQRQVCYEFGNGRQFLDTDRDKSGVYGIELFNDLYIDPVDVQNPNTYDSPSWLITEDGREIGTEK